MIPTIAAVLLALHGVIHLIGFVVPWRIASLDGFVYRTTAFNGALEVGDTGARLIGLAWLGLAIGFVVAGFGIWRGESWAVKLASGLAIVSLIVCVVGLPETVAGIVINAVILAAAGYVAFLKRALMPAGAKRPNGP